MTTPAVVTLSSDDVARSPPGVGGVPLSIKFSPDGSLLTYLYPDANGVRQVYAVQLTPDTTTSNQDVKPSSSSCYNPYRLFDASATTFGSGTDSLAEQLRKERMRLFVSGVSSYEWVQGAGCRIMLPLHGCVLLYDRDAGVDRPALQVVYDAEAETEVEAGREGQGQPRGERHGPALDPHLSPQGTSVAYVLNDDLYVQSLSQGAAPRRLTTNGAREGVSCGVADFIAQEEMDRYSAVQCSAVQ